MALRKCGKISSWHGVIKKIFIFRCGNRPAVRKDFVVFVVFGLLVAVVVKNSPQTKIPSRGSSQLSTVRFVVVVAHLYSVSFPAAHRTTSVLV